MQAVVCHNHEGLAGAVLEDVDSPRLLPGSVKIRVHACAASFASLLVMQGKHQNRLTPPFIPGTEVAGEIIAIDPGSNWHLAVGDRVIANVQSGGYAQEVVAPQSTVFHLPDGIRYHHGAQFPTIYGTAYAGLLWRARLRRGQWVLVVAAALQHWASPWPAEHG